MKTAIAALLLSAMSLFAADLTGKWNGTAVLTGPDGGTRTDSVMMVLKQTGEEVAGSIGRDAERQLAMKNGKIEKEKLSFAVETPDGTKLKFELTFDGTKLKGKGDIEGQQVQIALDFKRAE